MDLVGEFHKGEIDGEVYLICQKVMNPSPERHSANSSHKVAIDLGNDGLPLQTLFVCPALRLYSTVGAEDQKLSKCDTSPLYHDDRDDHHHVLPLFWCNNKEANPDGECAACKSPKLSTEYYLCVVCDERYHKECVESPLEIYYPTHSKLSFDFKHCLQLSYSGKQYIYCSVCGLIAKHMVYYCALCNVFVHVLCANMPLPFFCYIKRFHNHTLTLFLRQDSLTCNVCALVKKLHPVYVCSECSFVIHSSCMDKPNTIKMSRHTHRISLVSSLPLKKWCCGVCRQEVDRDYGAYMCNVCPGYVCHTTCATRPDICDGIELEGVPEKYENVEPFERIDEGVILHFSHGHHLRLEEVGKVYEENKFCQACGLLIYEGSFYACAECNFILHESCANAQRKTVNPVHPHPLNLEVLESEIQTCLFCFRMCNGFVYVCPNTNCDDDLKLDVRCALISEPFTYQGHPHSLYLSLDPDEHPRCQVCKSPDIMRVLNCLECDFIICFGCATLPYMVRYKHDDHYLTFCRGDEASDSDWCELCEGKLAIGGKQGFYKCEDCCTTLHINCLLGPEPYLVSGKAYGSRNNKTYIPRNISSSRKLCNLCEKRCPYPTFLAQEGYFACSFDCSGLDDYRS